MRFDRRLPPAVLLKYYLYQATTTFGFVTPVFTLFLLWRDLTYTQIGTLGSVSAVLVVVGEVPTGYVGDRFGRRASLLVGSAFLALSLLGFLVAQSFSAFVALYVLWALGLAFQSGSDDAWLYEVLDARLDANQFTHVRGRGASVNQWAGVATMLVSGVLYDSDPRLPFLVAAALLGCSLLVLVSMPATSSRTDREENTLFDVLPVLRRRLTVPPLRSTIVYLALFFGVTSAANTYVQPIVTGTIGIPETSLGPLYAGFTVLTATASYYAGAIEARLSTKWTLVLVPVVVSVFLLGSVLVPVAALPTFALLKAARSTVSPIASGYVNDHADAVGRATLLSAASMAYALVRVPLKPLTGVVADATAPLTALACLGGLFLACAAVVWLWETPVGDSTPQPDGATE
ncbi:MFS transporter (plasmid) [Haloferax larsenii]|uniref:MFS transporter n=1 Tax=Haloferax larsenii TaxID=302484 RepID=A0ABY5RJQ4_HALLR|nr:MFS transporter [Haloferax larsenii]ELZ80430.1 Major Facilitator Superfamily transporter [Haloferax larsenii JCM 13917]UVE52384.1 MFS transporter [Haloferax larsenii]